MLESPELIKQCLEISGDDITFITGANAPFTIKGIVGSIVTQIKGYDAQSFDINVQELVFRLSTQERLDKSIVEGDTADFTPSNTPNIKYSLVVETLKDDLQGWTRADLRVIGVESV